nr:hypothetical protein [Tanacetum cinerariifolium]
MFKFHISPSFLQQNSIIPSSLQQNSYHHPASPSPDFITTKTHTSTVSLTRNTTNETYRLFERSILASLKSCCRSDRFLSLVNCKFILLIRITNFRSENGDDGTAKFRECVRISSGYNILETTCFVELTNFSSSY